MREIARARPRERDKHRGITKREIKSKILSYSVEESGQKGDWDHNLANRRRLIRGNKIQERIRGLLSNIYPRKELKIEKVLHKRLAYLRRGLGKDEGGQGQRQNCEQNLGEDLIWKRRRKASMSFPRVI